jgi:hypothetical protein
MSDDVHEPLGVAHEDEEIPREVAEHYARDDSTLRRMIDKGLPLTRGGYLISAGIDRDPETGELTSDVPGCFHLRS